MYYCPDIKKQLRSKLEGFEYICTSKNAGEVWPNRKPFEPYAGDKEISDDDGYEKATAAIVRRDTIDSAIKASIAAAVTVVLVLVCVTADCVSKWKIRRRVSKAKAAAVASQTEQPLTQTKENETDDEEARAAAHTGQKQV